MSVKARGKSFEASVYGPKPESRRYRRSFPDQQSAELWEAESRVKLLRGEAPDMGEHARVVDGRTLADAFTAVYSVRWAGQKAEASVVANAEDAKLYFGSRPAASIKPEDITKYIVALKERHLSNGTINRKLSALRVLLEHASEHWGFKAPRITSLRESRGRDRFILPEEEAAGYQYLVQLGKPEYAALLVFLCHTGIRLGAALKCRWSWIADGWVTVPRKHSKNDRPYRVPLSDRLTEVLSGLDKTTLGPFEGMTHSSVTHVWNLMKLHLGLGSDEQFVPHCCRHAFGSRLAQDGVDLATIRDLMGHTSLQSTMRYAHLLPRNYQQAIRGTFDRAVSA